MKAIANWCASLLSGLSHVALCQPEMYSKIDAKTRGM